MTKILTLEEAKKTQNSVFCKYYNNDYEYETSDGFWHLIRNGVDLLEGVKAIDCYSYDNNDYSYINTDGVCHLIRDGIDLLDGLHAVKCHSFANNDYSYKDTNGFWISIKK